MSTMSLVHRAVGTAHLLPTRLRALATRARDERGLSQSTEQALLVAAAILIAGAIGVAVMTYVQGKLGARGITVTGGE